MPKVRQKNAICIETEVKNNLVRVGEERQVGRQDLQA